MRRVVIARLTHAFDLVVGSLADLTRRARTGLSYSRHSPYGAFSTARTISALFSVLTLFMR
jgi:hypothetical protein